MGVKSMFRKILPVVLLVGLMAALALAGPGVSVRGGHRDRAPVLAPQDFNLKRLEGKVVMMAFWRATDCLPCREYIEWLSKMQVTHGEKGLVIVAVNQDRESAAATDMLSMIHPRTQIILDPAGKMGADYQLEGMPSTYLYDRNLEMTYKFVDFVPEETDSLETAVATLLKQKYRD
jgi:thiol-disulfide isomerase/thioredoxin